ncbi:MAG: hypothetical protein LBH61_06830 [Dysgonamonadaceae bacterium]|jgi:hypothetical protein|nr:hypothetical protein [Dysgonamonadaceae bacterium]
MKKFFYLLFLILTGLHAPLSGRDIVWKAGVHSFFDNTEFGHSAVQIPQSMGGVHLAPEIGLDWKNGHRIFAGADVLHEFGSNKIVDYACPFVYYQYENRGFRFYMGAIPRQVALEEYPRMFFQDSIRNYRPSLNGFFWEYKRKENYANIWLDWVSRQTEKRHESFFMGWSGQYNRSLFYARHFGYMLHFAGVMHPEIPEAVHDNGLLLTSLGIDLAPATAFEKLELNAGWTTGLDRDRDIGRWNTPQGVLSELKIEYRGLGIFNTYYKGDSQQVFYDDHSNQLYWGDPVYRSTEYNRSDLYVYFIKTNVVKLKFIYSFHFMEGKAYHEQSFYATFDLDNLKNRKNEKRYTYLWDDWF